MLLILSSKVSNKCIVVLLQARGHIPPLCTNHFQAGLVFHTRNIRLHISAEKSYYRSKNGIGAYPKTPLNRQKLSVSNTSPETSPPCENCNQKLLQSINNKTYYNPWKCSNLGAHDVEDECRGGGWFVEVWAVDETKCKTKKNIITLSTEHEYINLKKNEISTYLLGFLQVAYKIQAPRP